MTSKKFPNLLINVNSHSRKNPMKFQAKMVSESSISVILNGKPYIVGSTHPKFKECFKAVMANKADEFLKLYGSTTPIKPTADFQVTESILVGHDRVTYKGQEIHNTVCTRLLDMQREGHDTKPLVKFLEKLLKNPSKWCVDALYKFLEAKGLPITEDGNVLGYKCVKSNWYDKFSGTVLNSIGSKHEILRNTVDDDRSRECSYGFHIGDLEYSGPNGLYHNPGDHIIICEFSPEDVVAVPEEAAAHKIRVCKYTVVSEYVQDLPDTFHNLTVEQLKHGDVIQFSLLVDNPYYDDVYDYEDDMISDVIVRMKFEGISKRSKSTRFYGRILKGSEWGVPGSSVSYLISEVSDIRKV